MSGFTTRWTTIQAIPVVQIDEDDDVSIPDPVPARHLQPDSSGEPPCTPSVRDAETQVSDWHTYSNDDIEYEISFRLSSCNFARVTVDHIPLIRDYERREEHKRLGALYTGTSKQWPIPPGRDLRLVTEAHAD